MVDRGRVEITGDLLHDLPWYLFSPKMKQALAVAA